MEKGKLIVIDGVCDHLGKSTVINQLLKVLKQKQIPTATKHFHDRDTLTGQYIEQFLVTDGLYDIKELPYKFVAELYLIDFLNGKRWIEEQLNQGVNVILDRYYTSTMIYQSTQARLHQEGSVPGAAGYIQNMIEYFKLPPIDHFFLLYTPKIIEEFYDKYGELDNFEDRKFQEELIKTSNTLRSTNDLFINAKKLDRLTSTGEIIESSDILKQIIDELGF